MKAAVRRREMSRLTIILVVAMGALLAAACSEQVGDPIAGSSEYVIPPSALLPDLRTVIPMQLGIQNTQQHEWLRFSNAVANTGAGPLQIRRVISGSTQDGVQELLDASGNVVYSQPVSTFVFHPTHHHWHIDNVARYEVRSGSPTGPVYASAIKVTSCLIDWYQLFTTGFSHDQVYWDCNADLQGISVNWADQYHQSLPDQEVDITGAPAGRYYLVSTAAPLGNFIEQSTTNNMAWTSFDLDRGSNGNPQIHIVGHSACEPGLCGENAPNH